MEWKFCDYLFLFFLNVVSVKKLRLVLVIKKYCVYSLWFVRWFGMLCDDDGLWYF